MGRIVALDVGRKRTGIAVTDPLRLIANSLVTLPTHELIGFLQRYVATEPVDVFVVGYPRQMNNSLSEAVKYIDPVIQNLKETFPGREIHLADERFTSKLAMQAMVMGGVKKRDRQNKSLLDSVSATIILQSYLEQLQIAEKRNTRNET
jgi:putative Holliday junction resolvase